MGTWDHMEGTPTTPSTGGLAWLAIPGAPDSG